MTLDQWQDIVSKMTPEQREAMAYFGEACFGFEGDAESITSVLKDELKCKFSEPYWIRLNQCRGIA